MSAKTDTFSLLARSGINRVAQAITEEGEGDHQHR